MPKTQSAFEAIEGQERAAAFRGHSNGYGLMRHVSVSFPPNEALRVSIASPNWPSYAHHLCLSDGGHLERCKRYDRGMGNAV